MRILNIFFTFFFYSWCVAQSGTGGGYVVSTGGDSSCIISGTRAQLLALRASNNPVYLSLINTDTLSEADGRRQAQGRLLA